MDISQGADFPKLTFAAIPFELDSILWLGFGIGCVAYVGMALIYHHHWSYYGISLAEKTLAVVIFNSLALVMLATVALLATSLSTM